MKETRMPPAQAAYLVANSGNTIYGVSVIVLVTPPLKTRYMYTVMYGGPEGTSLHKFFITLHIF